MRCVQIVYNNKQFQSQQQLTKNYPDFAKVVLRLIFIELKNRCFVYYFDGAKIDWVYDNFSEKD